MSANHNCGCNCTTSEMEALLCELLDDDLTQSRAQEIRARIAECEDCCTRLESEEVMRNLLRCCDNATQAPAHLKERITVQIRMTRVEYRW